MISKSIHFTVAEKDSLSFRSALQQVEEASQSESGCVYYAAFTEKDNTSEFTVLEIWDSEDSFEAHRQSKHLKDFKKACGDMIIAKTARDLMPLQEGAESAPGRK